VDPEGLQMDSTSTPPGYMEIMRMAMEEAYSNWVRLSQTSWWEWGPRNYHHLFPKMFKEQFSKIGIKNIDQYQIEVPKWMNQWFHRAESGVRGGWWNRQWRDFFEIWKDKMKTDPDYIRQEAFKFMEWLRKMEGVDDLPYGLKPKGSIPWWKFWIR